MATGCATSTVVQSVPATATTASTVAVDYEPFSVRLVLASAAPPCNSADAAVVPQGRSGRVIGCFTVGDATVTGRDVESAAMSSANAFSVNISLRDDGAKRLDDLFPEIRLTFPTRTRPTRTYPTIRSTSFVNNTGRRRSATRPSCSRWTDDAVSSLPSVQIDSCH